MRPLAKSLSDEIVLSAKVDNWAVGVGASDTTGVTDGDGGGTPSADSDSNLGGSKNAGRQAVAKANIRSVNERIT